jgi:hypothetical protein
MKFAVGIGPFFWLLSGIIGAWMMDDLDLVHWKRIARGPITLAEALNDEPITYQPSR